MSMNPSVPGASIFAALRGSATLVPLKHRLFAAVWIASLASNFGSLVQTVGASWLMTTIAPSPDIVALVQAATALPILLFSLPAGAVADIWQRRTVMLVAQSLMFIVATGLAILSQVGTITPGLLLAFTFALGTGAALYGPAWQAAVGEMVPRDKIPAAVALNSLGFNLARSLGPAIGGAIVAAAGPEAAFVFNAVSYLALIVVLIRWKAPPVEHRLPPESMIPAIAAGLRYATLSLVIRAVLVRTFAFGLCGSAIWALLPLVARHLVGGGPLTYGILLGALGIGAILGAILSTPLRQRLGGEMLVRGAVATFGLCTIAAAFIVDLVPLAIVLTAAGAGWVMTLSTFNVVVQMSSPRWVMGRAMAVYQMMTFGGLALGSWMWGVLADGLGIATSLALAGAAAVLLGLLLERRFRLPAYEQLNLEPSSAWPEPQVSLDFDPQSGPVIVTAEYKIAPKDVPAFLKAMRILRRNRRRDGARRWMLTQDVADPETWLERFEVATWLDHMRQHHRATVSDRTAENVVLALHKGPTPPRVRHFLERPLAAFGTERAQPASAQARETTVKSE
jgi:MFS family permease